MSEQNENTQTEEQQPDYAAQIANLQAQLEKVNNKNQELLSEKKKAQQAASEKEQAAALAAEESARKQGDIDALDKSWQEKLSKREQELTGELDSLRQYVQNTKVDAVAMQIANEISTVPDLMADKIKQRLSVEMVDGDYKTIVNDANGQRSALTVAELAAEFKANEAYKSVIKASEASGAGGAQNINTGGSANSSKGFLNMTTSEKVAHLKSKRG